MDVYAISVCKNEEKTSYYLDRLIKCDNIYCWEVYTEKISDDCPVYFYRHKREDIFYRQSALVPFQEKHLRFMTTKKALREKKLKSRSNTALALAFD